MLGKICNILVVMNGSQKPINVKFCVHKLTRFFLLKFEHCFMRNLLLRITFSVSTVKWR